MIEVDVQNPGGGFPGETHPKQLLGHLHLGPVVLPRKIHGDIQLPIADQHLSFPPGPLHGWFGITGTLLRLSLRLIPRHLIRPFLRDLHIGHPLSGSRLMQAYGFRYHRPKYVHSLCFCHIFFSSHVGMSFLETIKSTVFFQFKNIFFSGQVINQLRQIRGARTVSRGLKSDFSYLRFFSLELRLCLGLDFFWGGRADRGSHPYFRNFHQKRRDVIVRAGGLRGNGQRVHRLGDVRIIVQHCSCFYRVFHFGNPIAYE
jgi:hypothetical protein